jgi:hypothetical protein
MEADLKSMVLEHGFEAVYVALKGIVSSEYERAKRDFEFLVALDGKKEVVEASTETVEESAAVAEESKEEAVEPDTKKIEIVGEPAVKVGGRKVFRKSDKK